ncbi:MAG: GLPGLI family protein [Prevotella sp.]|jgi:GLPGLI family protein|nr:GLPGLI family protein [Prevotella sp.]
MNDIKKYIFWGFFIVLSCNMANAQIKIPRMTNLRTDTLEKKIIDNAKYRVYYSLEFAKDSLYPQDKTKGQTILFIGSKYNKFIDYNMYRKDSIYDALAKIKANQNEILAQLLPIGRLIIFNPVVTANYTTKGNYYIQQAVTSRSKYAYDDKNVQIKWDLVGQERIINGYKCKKAICKFRGREYIAWYATNLPINAGPYLFSGLPGLILEIQDTKNNYSFKINGLVNVKDNDPIYILTDNIVQTDRNQVRKAVDNLKKDPASILKSMGNAKVDPAVLAKLKPKPHNPIELE